MRIVYRSDDGEIYETLARARKADKVQAIENALMRKQSRCRHLKTKTRYFLSKNSSNDLDPEGHCVEVTCLSCGWKTAGDFANMHLWGHV